MKHWRFIFCVIGAYIIGFLVAMFFSYSSVVLQEPRLVLSAIILVPVITFIFGWLYFRGVKDILWRQRVEAIIVWMGLILVVDTAIITLWFKSSIFDIGTMALSGYGLEILSLFVSAYITASSEPKLSSPDLKIV